MSRWDSKCDELAVMMTNDMDMAMALSSNDVIETAQCLIKKGKEDSDWELTSGELYAFFLEVIGPEFNILNHIDSIGTPDSILSDGITENSSTQGSCCSVMSTIVIPSNIKTIGKNAKIRSTNVTEVIFDTDTAIPADFLRDCKLLQKVTFKRLPAKISDVTGKDLAEKNNIKFDFNNNNFDSSHVIVRSAWNSMKNSAVNLPDTSKKAIEKRLSDLAAYHKEQIDKYINDHQ